MNEDERTAFINWLREMVLELGITYARLAEGIGKSKETVNKYLSMELAPNQETVKEIIEFVKASSCFKTYHHIDNSQFLKIVNQAIKKYHIKQEDLAKVMGKTQKTVSLYLKGKSNIYLTTEQQYWILNLFASRGFCGVSCVVGNNLPLIQSRDMEIIDRNFEYRFHYRNDCYFLLMQNKEIFQQIDEIMFKIVPFSKTLYQLVTRQVKYLLAYPNKKYKSFKDFSIEIDTIVNQTEDKQVFEELSTISASRKIYLYQALSVLPVNRFPKQEWFTNQSIELIVEWRCRLPMQWQQAILTYPKAFFDFNYLSYDSIDYFFLKKLAEEENNQNLLHNIEKIAFLGYYESVYENYGIGYIFIEEPTKEERQEIAFQENEEAFQRHQERMKNFQSYIEMSFLAEKIHLLESYSMDETLVSEYNPQNKGKFMELLQATSYQNCDVIGILSAKLKLTREKWYLLALLELSEPSNVLKTLFEYVGKDADGYLNELYSHS